MTKSQLAFEAWFPTLNPTWSHADMFKRRNCGDYESIVTITAWTAWQASRKAALEEAIDCCTPKPYKGEGSFFPSPMMASEAQTRIKELL